MILLFPNLDTLRLAMTGSIVPPEVTLAPATVSFDDQGKIYLESTAALSRTVTKNLDRIGVKGSKRHAGEAPEEVTCWPQVLPLTRETGTPNVSNQAPVLFELSHADDLPVLVMEMLRLGNDRQSFRWFAAPGEPDTRRVLLRVIGPPYYTLLRAIDSSASGTKGTVRAYLERAPRVWIELGHNHPLGTQIRAADRQLLLIHSPREWIYLEEAPFQDVYDILQFKLPAAPVGWTETRSPDNVQVKLRLTAGNAADVPELWVLRENAIEQLDTLVRDSDERLTQRLMFAVATDPDGNRTVILRTRPSKQAAPALPLEKAQGFKPFWKLPNLFVPVGRRLHPTLRRDAVRKLLADDADQVVWLYPGADGRFTPESVPDGAFRSLEDWVDYVIEAEQKPLAAWIEATRFDFDHFICKETGGPKNKPDKGDRDRARDEADEARAARDSAGPRPSSKRSAPPAKPSAAADFIPAPEVVKPPSEWVKRRTELEDQFKAVEGGLDIPERKALWPQLAEANMGAGDKTEAAICWLNAMWEIDPIPAGWLGAWLRSELPTSGSTIKAEEFDRRLAQTGPGQEEARAAIAGFLWLAAQDPVPSWLLSRLPAVQNYLEKNEGALPVRAVWLTGCRLAQLSGSDVLGLARVRDRLLQRLLDQGLTAERDLPMFLRTAGLKDSERIRVVNEKATELHAAVRKWTESIPVNMPYVDLLFAFAIGKLGESSKARKLVEEARKVMEVPIPVPRNPQDDQKLIGPIVSNFLFKAFKYRIDQVLMAKPHAGQLSEEVLAELEDIHKRSGSGPANNPYKLAHYVISRMRDRSQVLEPHEKLDPYAEWTKSTDPLKKELADLHAIRDPGKLADQVRRLYKSGVPGRTTKETQFHLLHEALPLSPRVGESFTVELLNLVPAALQSGTGGPEMPDLARKQGELLERSMFLAGHFDRADLVKKLMDEFSDLIHSKPEDARFKLINVVAGQCLRSLKRLGMRDEIDRFLTKLRNDVLRGATTADLKKKHSAKPDMWGSVLQTLLNLAAGWLTFGLHDHAEPILVEARNELLNPQAVKLPPQNYTELACAYVSALGQGPSETGLLRITELFRKMDDKKITNTWTTAQYYSRFHLDLVQAVIFAIMSDDFALGPSGRRWLDDDEYIVRRRIHAVMKREREKSGLESHG
jgi:hypothetical protein